MFQHKRRKVLLDRSHPAFKLSWLIIGSLFMFYVLWFVISIQRASLDSLLPYAVLALILGFFAYHEGKRYFDAKEAVRDISLMAPYEFEQYIAGLFRRMGYSAEVTQKSDYEKGGDYGADIIARKDGRTIVVQVKKWAPHNLVGAPDVRSVLGCLHTFKAEKAILLTTSDFTEQAHKQAKGAPIELWDGAYLERMIKEYS